MPLPRPGCLHRTTPGWLSSTVGCPSLRQKTPSFMLVLGKAKHVPGTETQHSLQKRCKGKSRNDRPRNSQLTRVLGVTILLNQVISPVPTTYFQSQPPSIQFLWSNTITIWLSLSSTKSFKSIWWFLDCHLSLTQKYWQRYRRTEQMQPAKQWETVFPREEKEKSSQSVCCPS